MEDGASTPNSMFGDNVMDLDFMDELFSDGCWLESSDGFNFLQPGPSTSDALNNPLQHISSLDANTGHLSIISHQQNQQNTKEEIKFNENSTLVYPKEHEVLETNFQNQNVLDTNMSLMQPGSFLFEGTESGKRWWIRPSAIPSSSSSVKDRLVQAIGYLQKCTIAEDVLIQIWVPIKEGGRQVLTTEGQPYSLNTNCKSLASYRKISKTYHFAAEQDSKTFVGLPGRVFLEKVPEWTPDVSFFGSDEYPRIGFAQQYKVRGSIALPIFEQGSGTCLGVIEIVTTSQKMNYRPELDCVCKALEAVDLRSSQNFCPPSVKDSNELYQAAVPKIAEILASICNIYSFPLALTWAPCVQQGKDGCRHSDANYASCVSTVDSACIVAIKDFSDFHEACSEHHLFHGQGIVGRAFMTNKICFSTNITAFSKTNYPLSHHARMFGLCAAVAYPLQSIYSGSIEFVLEFYLPKDCQESEQQKRILNSLSIAVQQACQNLYFVIEQKLEEDVILPVREMIVASDGKFDAVETQKSGSSSKKSSPAKSSGIVHMMEGQQKGKDVSVLWEFQKEDATEEFHVTTHSDNSQEEMYHKQDFSEFEQLQQNSGPKGSANAGGVSSSCGSHRLSAGTKAGEKRRTKTEKTISLEVLRQHFGGSLKDAAKSIGVCPTTLKRICRQHGITRWPSRKIKKVGHSLKKLQLVIDSVQGAKGAIQIGSFYKSFPELRSPNSSGIGPFSSLKRSDHSMQINPQSESGLFTHGVAAPKSPSSSCSQSSGSSTCGSTGAKQLHTTPINASASGDTLPSEEPSGLLKRVDSNAEPLALKQEQKLLASCQSQKTIGEHPNVETLQPAPKGSYQTLCAGSSRVKATFGEEKIRFTLKNSWTFKDLQQEIARRFNIDVVSRVDLKYLDDDHEWVLLTCDADLEECIDIHKSTQSHTLKISVHQTPYKILGGSFDSKV
ncbi:PB1 domain-containing protein/RWP-RK domain-containing protein [Cephalotus follicularis]|uniref:PB1 domain-containing protein/RWP-RK domain-containing protein n=1 Tax=Cephalotus follicularis TaxID=3775 RepID=A0A1Q3AX44_CEPFO|nr:PB1 domain-containing protein/RWP-RK domain-containing protein [Cephalotus follicularis]